MADTIYNWLLKQDNLKTFVRLAGICDDLPTKLNAKDEYTLFVPTDEAFAKLPPGTIEKLHNDTDLLQDIFNFHLVRGIHNSKELLELAESKQTLMAEDHNPISFIKKGDSLWAGSDSKKAKVITPDLEASNGIIHIIDDVLAIQAS